MTKDELNNADRYHAAKYLMPFLKRLVPIPLGSKDPGGRGWQRKTYEEKDFVGEGNLGVCTGQEIDKDAYFADVDVDAKCDDGTMTPGASDVVAELMPQSGLVWGRVSAPRTHMGYVTVVSGHKSNNSNWLQSSMSSNWEPMSKTALEMGVFSNRVTLRICKSL